MFKSSFAREILEETRHNANVSEAILPRERHTIYKSNFAATTHTALDNIPVNLEPTAIIANNSTAATVGGRFPFRNNNNNITTHIIPEVQSPELTTSDLGTSDFSSSEIWPGSGSAGSERRLEDLISAYPSAKEFNHAFAAAKDLNNSLYAASSLAKDLNNGSSLYASAKDVNDMYSSSSSKIGDKGNSFLNLQSQMSFSYLQQVCSDLDVGLEDADWNALRQIMLGRESTDEGTVVLGDFLSELQSLRRGKGGRKKTSVTSRNTPESMSTENTSDSDEGKDYEEKDRYHATYVQGELNRTEDDLHAREDDIHGREEVSSKEMSAKLAAKELETLQVRLECQQLYSENLKLRQEFNHLKGFSSPRRFLELQKEIEHLHWQLNKMENSRKLYELATTQLVTFLEQVSVSLASTSSLRGSRGNLEDAGGCGGVLSRENLLHARELSLASLHMARSQSMPGLAPAVGGGGGGSRRSRRLPAHRVGAGAGDLVRRSSSVSRTRLTSPLPSLAEQEDRKTEDETMSVASQDRSHSVSVDLTEHNGDSLSLDSHRMYRRSNSVSDPLCVSTPRSTKCRLGGDSARNSSRRNTHRIIDRRRSDDIAVERGSSSSDFRAGKDIVVTSGSSGVMEHHHHRRRMSIDDSDQSIDRSGANAFLPASSSTLLLDKQSVERRPTDHAISISEHQSECSFDLRSEEKHRRKTTTAGGGAVGGGDESESEISKRGTLTSLSSGSTASPPSTATSRSRDDTSYESVPGIIKSSRSKSMSTLNSLSTDDSRHRLTSTSTGSESKTQLASTAQRLLRSLRLVLAREKSYNVSQAEGREKTTSRDKMADLKDKQKKLAKNRCSSASSLPRDLGAIAGGPRASAYYAKPGLRAASASAAAAAKPVAARPILRKPAAAAAGLDPAAARRKMRESSPEEILQVVDPTKIKIRECVQQQQPRRKTQQQQHPEEEESRGKHHAAGVAAGTGSCSVRGAPGKSDERGNSSTQGSTSSSSSSSVGGGGGGASDSSVRHCYATASSSPLLLKEDVTTAGASGVRPAAIADIMSASSSNPKFIQKKPEVRVDVWKPAVVATAAAKDVKRSKSDAQDFYTTFAAGGEEEKTARKKLTTSLVKRSRSFHKIFSQSMLNKSKEYNFY